MTITDALEAGALNGFGDAGQRAFRGFDSPNYTQVPDILFDERMAHLSGAELKVLLYIIRRTFGFKKDHDAISINQIVSGITTKEGKVLDIGTGLSKDSVARALKGLEEKRVIIRERRISADRGFEPTTFRLNMYTPLSENRAHKKQVNKKQLRMVGFVSDNEIAAFGVPAILVTSPRAEVSVLHNRLEGTSFALGQNEVAVVAGSAFLGAAAEIVPESALLLGNRFRSRQQGDSPVIYAVGVRSPNITYVGNRSVCDNMPRRTNVLLLAGDVEQNVGSITAVSNTCREPQPVRPPEGPDILRDRLCDLIARENIVEPLRSRLAALVEQPMSADELRSAVRDMTAGTDMPDETRRRLDEIIARPPAIDETIRAIRAGLTQVETQRHETLNAFLTDRLALDDFRKSIDDLDQRRLQLEERLRALEAAPVEVQISLVAMAGVAVTGMNLLSYRLARSGRGSDQGTESGVF